MEDYKLISDDFINNIDPDNLLSLDKNQPYLPIFKNIFYNQDISCVNITFNNKFYINKILSEETYNIFNCNITKDNLSKVYIKFSPLLDPLKYMTSENDISINKLPIAENTTDKEGSVNNSAYVEALFYFISNKLLTDNNFINSVKFYNSFIGIKNNFTLNIIDDIEYLFSSKHFNNNINIKFTVDELGSIQSFGSRKNKEKLKINSNKKNISIDELKPLDEPPSSVKKASNNNSSYSSNCSSRSSHSSNGSFNISCSSNSSNESMYSDFDECINAYIYKFPVNLICIENCHETLDDYMINNKINKDEWISILFQILITLATYQKAFSFTHNDLHSNNIMYTETDKIHIYYFYNNTYYKVKTFGKIWKIIDYGRSIFTYNDKLFCSDSFSPDGDAFKQYNTEPYFDKDKKRIDPNYSFDLCRLACSLYDYFDELDDKKLKDINNIICEWCEDDNKKNILYKKSGIERYPDFKLYKMISRTVNNHIPSKEINRSIFKSLIIKKNDAKNKKIINVDKILCPSKIQEDQ